MASSAMAAPVDQSVGAADVQLNLDDLTSCVSTPTRLPGDTLSPGAHIGEHGSCLNSQPGLSILGRALMAMHITVDDSSPCHSTCSSPCHSTCVPTDDEDDTDDVSSDEIVASVDGSSCGSEVEGYECDSFKPQRAQDGLRLIGRMHVGVAGTVGTMRKGMSRLGDRLEALGDSLDDAAEKCAHQIHTAAEKYAPQIELFEDAVRVNIIALSDTSHATYEKLDGTATKCKRHLEGSAEIVVERARALSHAAESVRVKRARALSHAAVSVRAKTGEFATVGSVRKSFQRARGKMQPRNVRKGFGFACDRINQSWDFRWGA